MPTNYYTTRLFEFLREVSNNNNREWFHAHKDEYDELRGLWMADLERMLSLMTAWEPQLVSQSAKTCAYRFYRDTRFSQDKSPYKELVKHYPGWIGDRLKKVPAGWDKDHPQSELLKLKEHGRLCPCKEKFFTDPSWVEIAAERFSLLKPLVDFINYSLDEDI